MKRVSGGAVETRSKRQALTSADVSSAINRINHPPPRHRQQPAAVAPVRRGGFSHLSISRELDPDQGGFYITPFEVINYLDNRVPSLFEGNRLNLRKVAQMFHNIETSGQAYLNFWPQAQRDDPAFVENEILKMVSDDQQHNRKWIFPMLVGSDKSTLSIPSKDVFDLPVYVLLYILKRLTQFPKGYPSFTIGYNLGVIGDNTIYPINRENGEVIKVVNGYISGSDLSKIYMTIIRQFASFLNNSGVDMSWNGSEDSGTRVMLINLAGPNVRLHLKLKFTPTASVSHAHGWTQQVEDMLEASVGSSVISVRNRDDNKCLIYCIIIALIMKFKEGSARIFGQGTMMVEPSTVYAKGMYMFFDDTNEITILIKRLCRLLLPPNYSDGPVDPLIKYIEDIDKKAGTMISIEEFRKEFSEIEEKLIPDGICGIDVYGIDYNVNKHLYPLYISKNRGKVIELLCVTPLDTRCSHYCAIVNMEKLLKNTGGKQFFSCSKCGASFYHKRLLRDHKCPVNIDNTEVEGDGGYHYSSKNVDRECDIVCGVCSKCRLCFTDEFTTEYHKKHCFMEGKTGYRHVQLVTYKKGEHPMLNGEEIDMEEEEKHVRRRRIMYADFESSINPETGEHSFMSYGIYEFKSGVYKCGYNLHEFLEFILNVAYHNEEDQIYVYFHNAMGYDANFILRHVLQTPEYASWGIQVIMKSSNKLQKLVLHTHKGDKSRAIHIGDTFLFLTLSLERLVASIRKDDVKINMENFDHFFKIFKKRYPFANNMEIDHILRKNIFPYKFFSDASKLRTPIDDFTRIFEPRENNLQYFSERVTLDDLANGYADTKSVIKTFKCETARDYHDLYLCCDVMQLTDIFDRCMKTLWESHHIHLTKYLGMPSASWAAFLRNDPTMSIPLYEDTFFAEFFQGMIRGGITSAPLRHAVADENHSIIYLDVNGLYPYVMQAYDFPCGHFTFMPFGWGEELSKVKLNEYFKLFEEEHKGMCFCVDLHIPPEVKKLTDMYPFAPEHRKIYKEYFSNPDTKEMTPFLQKWSDANNGAKMSEFTGLVCTLYDKEKYNVHWRLLKFYMEHGVVVKKVYFGVMFDEGDYLRSYIRKNIEIRNTRKDELGKTAYKLLGNAIYGKTFESPFKRNTFEIVRDQVKLQGLLEEGNVAAVIPITKLDPIVPGDINNENDEEDNIDTIDMAPTIAWIVRFDGEDIILDKPTYIGAVVCEYAKLHMYTLLYDKLMKIFPGTEDDIGCQLVYTDTDSFIVRVRHPPGVTSDSKTLFEYIKEQDPDLIGSIGGQVKSETGEDTIQEIIALRSKVYAYKTKSGHEDRRAKGTTGWGQDQCEFEVYKDVLYNLKSFDTHNMQILRRVFKLASLDVVRQSLSANDGKRQILDDGIHTHAFGYDI